MKNNLGILPGFRKYLIAYMLFAFAVFGVFYIALVERAERKMLNDLRVNSRIISRILLSNNLLASPKTQTLLESFGRENGCFLEIFLMDGNLAAASSSNGITESYKSGYQDKIVVVSGWKCGVFRELREGNNLSVFLPVCQDQKPVAVVKITADSRVLNKEKIGNGLIFLTLYLFAVVLFCLVLLRFSTKFNEMESGLIRSMKDIEEGNFHVSTMRYDSSEWQDIADGLNSMAIMLNESFSRLTSDKEWLEAVVSSIRGGLLVVDSLQKIVLANEQMKEIIGFSFPEGRFYWEAIRDLSLLESIEKLEANAAGLIEELTIQNKTYIAHLSALGRSGGLVLILYDITESKNLEKIKKDFVANVSHELKTPLTAIKGFVEALLEKENKDDQKRYLDIIIRNTDRLSRIISDLLTLSEIEEKGLQIEMEKVNVRELLERVTRLFTEQYQRKGLLLELSVDGSVSIIRADGFRLEQLFINLIDNAFKYTEHGGTKVTASVSGDKALFEISDTGVGIPEKDIPRLFERFYVVDKSRSRNQGGTGLGLSIVKHIVLLHHGEIEVKSALGVGTRFIIRLPVGGEGKTNE